MNILPFQKSEENFRKYELLLKVAVDAFPKKVKLSQIDHISNNTLVARLRDAKLSLLQNNWQTVVDVKKLKETEIVFRIEQGEVFSGPRKKEVKTYQPPTQLPNESLIIETKSLNEQEIICLLASRRLLVAPLTVEGITLVDYLRDNYDVLITKTEREGVYVIE